MIYVCIPAHDEEKTIGLLLWKVRTVLTELGRDFEVVVMQDASRDGTPEVLERYARVLPLRVLTSEKRLGYAQSVERLLRDVTRRAMYPKRDMVVTLQADFSDDPADMVSLIKTVEGGADLVAGAPDGERGTPPRGVRWARWLAPRVVGNAWHRSPVTDPSSGYRAFRVIVLKKMLAERKDDRVMSLDGWAGNMQLLHSAAPHARRIEEESVAPNHILRQRATRFRVFPTVRDLARFRGAQWPFEAGGES